MARLKDPVNLILYLLYDKRDKLESRRMLKRTTREIRKKEGGLLAADGRYELFTTYIQDKKHTSFNCTDKTSPIKICKHTEIKPHRLRAGNKCSLFFLIFPARITIVSASVNYS